jgi:hypothetical protein
MASMCELLQTITAIIVRLHNNTYYLFIYGFQHSSALLVTYRFTIDAQESVSQNLSLS